MAKSISSTSVTPALHCRDQDESANEGEDREPIFLEPEVIIVPELKSEPSWEKEAEGESSLVEQPEVASIPLFNLKDDLDLEEKDTYLEEEEQSSSRDKPLMCRLCGWTCVEHEQFVAHKLKHRGDKPYPCEICGRRFSNKDNLGLHWHNHINIQSNSVRKNTENKSFKCDDCGKVFRRCAYLSLHRRTHTGERPYSCNICGKAFFKSNQLAVHVRIHSGERPYRCDICGKKFLQMGHLKGHARAHTGERPFKCDYCDRPFSKKCHLMDHQRIHTGERPFQCEDCNKCFYDKSALSKHCKAHHMDKNKDSYD